ncbi:MAG: arginine--tRNA ligase [Candidatus Paceibacterota bacterium]
MVQNELKKAVIGALGNLKIEAPEIVLEHPADLSHGDFSTNVALACAKKVGKNPRELAELIIKEISQRQLKEIESISVAGPGFINFKLSAKFLGEEMAKIVEDGNFGRNQSLKGKKVIVEYTDPNPFKQFHIGHLMSNSIGESIARLFEYTGAEVKRANYQGDVGLHVAKAIWGMEHKAKELAEAKSNNPSEQVAFLGSCYAFGAKDDSEKAKKEIQDLNKKVYERSDEKINQLFDWGRKASLDYFETIYHKLGTKFDFYFFESEVGPIGKQVVEEFLPHGVFEKSDGAVIFKGEDHGLHTRVFLNKEGLPTYEAKELGLSKVKHDKYSYDISVVVTGNEIKEYFKVLLCAMSLVFPELARKTKHLSHGMLRLPTGKMSSRTGDVITGESLLLGVESMVHEKIAERELVTEEKNRIANEVSVGAIKYSILRQAIGGDIIFDLEKSISFEGDSGPYLQYSYARAQSVLRKAKLQGPALYDKAGPCNEVGVLERHLIRFPEVVERAQQEFSPHHIATYLIEIAGAFNSFYANTKIIGSGEGEYYRLVLVRAFSQVMKNGLYLLGIKSPEVM